MIIVGGQITSQTKLGKLV